MSQILVRNLSPETVERLKKRAEKNKRPLEAEVREILYEAASDSNTPEYHEYLSEIALGKNQAVAFRDFVEKTRTRVGPQSSDSTELVRQARDELDAKASGELRR
jgi:plasmid stability protein